MPGLNFNISEMAEAKLYDLIVDSLQQNRAGFTLNFINSPLDWNGIKVEQLDIQICFFLPKEPKYVIPESSPPSPGDPGTLPLG